MKIKYFFPLFLIHSLCWGQFYIVSTPVALDTVPGQEGLIIRPGKWFPVIVEYSGPAVPDSDWCFDLYPLLVTTIDTFVAGDIIGNLFPNRAQLVSGKWDGLCFYEPPDVLPGGFPIQIKAYTYIPPAPPIEGQSPDGLHVWGGPYEEEKQIRAYPNPFGAAELTMHNKPPPGHTIISVYPISVRGYGDVAMKIFDSFGQSVKTFIPSEIDKDETIIRGFKDPERCCIKADWDGKNDRGQKVANGVYQVCVRVEEEEGEKVYTQKIGVCW